MRASLDGIGVEQKSAFRRTRHMPSPWVPEKKAAWIMAAIVAAEGTWVGFNVATNARGFCRYLGLLPGSNTGVWPGWFLAAIVTLLFVIRASRLPSVRANLFKPSRLKVLALALAVSAGILEEVFFRRLPMDYLQNRDFGPFPQIAASAFLFGIVHGTWALMGKSLRAGWGATLATSALGAALAVVYLAGGRSLAPCVAAHFAINVFIEPGLVLAATRGEMGRRRHAAQSV
jgi:membrane protease YdiL (CAAX protease family)